MLLNLLRWLRGYVCFNVSGKFPERFMNIVTSSGIPLWNTKNSADTLSAEMYASDYKRIRKYAKKSRVTLKHTKKAGLPFYVQKHRNRLGVLIGLGIMIAVVSTMSCFVWTIEVTGLETISYSELMYTLQDNGLYVGTFKPIVNYKNISRQTMLKLDKIGWMSINVIGTHASVEIKEKALSPFVDDYTKPCNVKAKCDGVIRNIETTSGVALFKAGSAVAKDQLIVSGVVKDSLGGVSVVRADARVIADTTHKKTFEINKDIKQYEFSEPFNRYIVDILGLKLYISYNFADSRSAAHHFDKSSLSMFDVTLPVSSTLDRVYEKTSTTRAVDSKTAMLILQKRSAMYALFNLSDCTVKNVKASFAENDNGYKYKVEYSCEEDIAVQHDIIADDLTIQRKHYSPDEDNADN